MTRELTLKKLFSEKTDVEAANLALQMFFSVKRSERTTYEDKLALAARRSVLKNGRPRSMRCFEISLYRCMKVKRPKLVIAVHDDFSAQSRFVQLLTR